MYVATLISDIPHYIIIDAQFKNYEADNLYTVILLQ